MVRQDLSLTEIIKKGEPYLIDVNIGEVKSKILNLILKYKLDNRYEELKNSEQWERWSMLGDMPKYYLDFIPTRDKKLIGSEPRVRLMDWADGADTRCPVIKFEVYVKK